MGSIRNYLIILIMMDLIFIITGQLCSNGICSFTSVIFSSIFHPENILSLDFYAQIVGNPIALVGGLAVATGIGFLIQQLTSGGISAGSLINGLKNDSILFAPTGIALSLIVGDFINVFDYIYSTSGAIPAVLIFTPLTMIYVFACLEWVRGMN